MRRHFATGASTTFILALSACGGGSSTGNTTKPTPPPPSAPSAASLPSPLPSPATTASNEDYDTTEYRSSSAAIASNAIGAWQKGATGKGITIGFVDTGLVPSLSDFAGRIDPASVDVVRNGPMDDVYGHGTAVAGIAAAAKDDNGIQGIAFQATIFMAKADQGCPNSCSFAPDDIAKGIDAARLAGAKVINLSIGGATSSTVTNAVIRAVNAGIIIVIGAGNQGTAPSELARELASAAPGQVIIVGGLGVTNADGTINYNVPSIYTTPAGNSQGTFLAAPGWLNSATYFRGGGIDKLSGTSFAAPVVSGAIALLAQAFPTLTPQQIVLLLYLSADDLGAAGTDATFGRGRLNIGRAFQPVGTLKIASSLAPVSPTINGTLPAAAGDAARRGNITTVVLDEFKRAFDFNLAATLRGQAEPGPLAQSIVAGQRTSFSAIGPVGIAVTVDGLGLNNGSVRQLSLSDDQNAAARVIAATAITSLGAHSSLALGFRTGSAGLRQQLAPGYSNSFLLMRETSVQEGFVADDRQSIAYQHRLGSTQLTIASERGAVRTLAYDRQRPTYSSVGVTVERPFLSGHLTATISRIGESQTVLGGSFESFFGESGSETFSADTKFDQPLGAGWSFSAAYRQGWTKFSSGYFTTSASSVEVTKAGIFGARDKLAVRLSQPLRIEHGGLALIVPIKWDYATRSSIDSMRRLSLSPSGREIAFEAGYLTAVRGGWFSFHAYGRKDPGHIRKSGPDLGVAVRTQIKF